MMACHQPTVRDLAGFARAGLGTSGAVSVGVLLIIAGFCAATGEWLSMILALGWSITWVGYGVMKAMFDGLLSVAEKAQDIAAKVILHRANPMGEG